MGLARSASYDILTALTIEGQFDPQSYGSAQCNPPANFTTMVLLFIQIDTPTRTNTPFSLPHCPHPQELMTTELGRRPRPSTAPDIWPMAKPNHATAYVFPPSSVRPLLRSHTAPQRGKKTAAALSSDSTPRSNPRPMTTSNTRRKLASLIVCHLFARPPSPFPDGKCPTVHRSTADPSIVNPRCYTSPRSRLFISSALHI